MPYLDDNTQDHTESTTTKPLNNTKNALQAIKRGYQPVPLIAGEKRPKLSGWSKIRWENTPEGLQHAKEQFDQWADEGNGGLGVLLGEPSGGLIDVDLDHPRTRRLKDHFLPPTPARSGRPGNPSSHYWYIAKEGTLQEPRILKMEDRKTVSVEYRSTGGQTALPGSVHTSGEAYSWDGKPWGGDDGPRVVDGRVLAVQTALLGFCTLLANSWATEGSRHEAFLALAGGLLRVGEGVHPYWAKNAEVVISAIADATGDDADKRVTETLHTTLKRLRTGGKASGFTKLSEIIGEEVVKQARVILKEIESLAGLPSRDSGSFTLEDVEYATGNTSGPTERVPGTDEIPRPVEKTVTTEDLRKRALGDDYEPEELEEEKRDPLTERLGSWEALDLDPYLSGEVQSVEPTVLERDDGQALLYPGRLNMLYGPSEAAKSWISMFASIQQMERGERVVYLDFEDEPVNALDRMKLLGASYDDLRRNFKYVRPEEPLATMQRSRWGEPKATPKGEYNERLFWNMLDAHDPALIVADGMTVLYGLHGLDSNDSVQTDTITSWLKTLTRNGRSTVLIVDHTAKNPQRGSMPIGSQHKVSMVQGALLQTFPVRQPIPGAVGEVDLLVLKDRPGKVREISEKSGEKAQLAARVMMDSTIPGVTKMTLENPQAKKVERNEKGVREDANEIDLRHHEAAKRADRINKENETVLEVFGNKLDVEYRLTDILARIYGENNHGDEEKKLTRRVLRRLVTEGWLGMTGQTRNAAYVLAMAELDD